MDPKKQNSSGMMQVYSLANWEIIREKPEKEWFIYQNDSTDSLLDYTNM
jgi:hypothetical protein